MWFRRKLDTTPNGEVLDKRELERTIKAAGSPKGPCHQYALEACYKYQKMGLLYRFHIGEYKGLRHAWCEYKDGDTWYVDDKAQRIKGWTREQCKDYQSFFSSVPDYRKVG